jgi:hypothetical protein
VKFIKKRTLFATPFSRSKHCGYHPGAFFGSYEFLRNSFSARGRMGSVLSASGFGAWDIWITDAEERAFQHDNRACSDSGDDSCRGDFYFYGSLSASQLKKKSFV